MSSGPPTLELQRYYIKADAVSAEKVWDFVDRNGLQMYTRGRTLARKYTYEVYMTGEDYLSFKLTHPELEILHMSEKPAVEDLMVTQYIEVPQAETHATLVKLRRHFGQTCVVSLTDRRARQQDHVVIKIVLLEGSEDENAFLLTYGHQVVS